MTALDIPALRARAELAKHRGILMMLDHNTLTALLDAAEAMAGVRAGTHRIVPVEPTPAMITAGTQTGWQARVGRGECGHTPVAEVIAIYHAMLSASPLPAAKEPTDG